MPTPYRPKLPPRRPVRPVIDEAGPPDISIEFTDGNKSPISLAPDGIAKAVGYLREEIEAELVTLSAEVENDLRHKYEVALHDLPRNEGVTLRDAIMQAMRHQVSVRQSELAASVFDAERAIQQTSGDRLGLRNKSLLELFEDGHTGRRHGSARYGFISLDSALGLAARAADMAGMDAAARQAFLARVRHDFAGRHGGAAGDEEAGIMRRIDGGDNGKGNPLFYEVPEFGDAGEFIKPHPGYEAMNVLYRYTGPQAGDWLGAAMERAFDRAADRVRKGS